MWKYSIYTESNWINSNDWVYLEDVSMCPTIGRIPNYIPTYRRVINMTVDWIKDDWEDKILNLVLPIIWISGMITLLIILLWRLYGTK